MTALPLRLGFSERIDLDQSAPCGGFGTNPKTQNPGRGAAQNPKPGPLRGPKPKTRAVNVRYRSQGW